MESTLAIKLLEKKLTQLNEFKLNLGDQNKNEFELLKSEIFALLNDNQRIRFNRIEFFSEVPDYKKLNEDDLPF